ncbi:ATP-binding protein [Nocardiopsis prasina]|uniref:ATP-binding protein n=1 Tax=Nocardiopsis prasina TaxID=2015 RepID=UPI00034CA822|nr:ATP-binding protein [Nocardiopsis prasina]
MAVHLSDRKRPHPRPGQQALVALLVASAVAAPAWSWAVIETPEPARPVIALLGGVVALLLCAAVATAAHHAAVARITRAHGTRVSAGARTLEEETGRVVDALLPALSHAAREGRPLQRVLADHPRPTHPTVDRLAHALTTQLADAERRATEARTARTEIENEVTDLADTTLPFIVHRVRQDRTIAEEVLAQELREVHPAVAHLRTRVIEELVTAERRSATALISAANIGGRVQAHLTTLLAQLRDLEFRYGDRSDVFNDLLLVDHNVSRTGRLADAFVTLARGRSGRRWNRPIGMESILRGAQGRITAYRRVRLHYTHRSAVVGYAAEGVIQVLAELMDNAANFSANGTDVNVYAQEEDSGVTVTVEDSGRGLRQRERRAAENYIEEPRTLATLPGLRMGLAVVGALADKYDLQVSFRPSARGGTGVVVLIPPNLITAYEMPLPPRLQKERDEELAREAELAERAAATRTPGPGAPAVDASALDQEPQPPAPPAFTAGDPAPSDPGVDVLAGDTPATGTPSSGIPVAGAPSASSRPWTRAEPTPSRPPLARRDGGRRAAAKADPLADVADEPVTGSARGTGPATRSDGDAGPEPVFDLPQRFRGLTLAQAVRENPEQLFPSMRRDFDPDTRRELPSRLAAFRDDDEDDDQVNGPGTLWEDGR